MKKVLVKRVMLCLLIALMVMLCVSSIAEELVLVNDENMVITVKEFDEDGFWGPTMKVYLENKTDKQLMYSIDSCAVNGVMNDPFWAKELPAGSKANAEISWTDLSGNAASAGITKVELCFKVYDSDDWMADNLLYQDFTIYPKGKSNAVIDQFIPDQDDIVLFDNEEVSMIVTGFENDELWGYSARVYLNNKTDAQLMFSVKSAVVNGYVCDPFWAREVRGHAADYASISWLPDEFEENGITEVEEITLAISVYDSNNWMDDALLEKQFIIRP